MSEPHSFTPNSAGLCTVCGKPAQHPNHSESWTYAVTMRAVPHSTAGWEALAAQLKSKQDEREGAPT